MTNPSDPSQSPRTRANWKALDRDLNRISRIEYATLHLSRSLVTLGLGLIFVALAALWAALIVGGTPGTLIVIVASAFGAYLALNIGANDVANNMGPAVGAKALPMVGALIIAAVCETAGAVIAGGEVVDTIASGIVRQDSFASDAMFVTAMLAALLSSALWINLATWIGAPVSTTHAIVGGVVGVGAMAAGVGAVDWSTMSQIAASWVISPVMGGGLAALALWIINRLIVERQDKIAAARTWVPVLIGVMAWAFGAYLALKGLKNLFPISLGGAVMIGGAVGIVAYAASRPYVLHQSRSLDNRNKSLKILFHLPLILSAALLSFAHGANDVSNAIGPLAAIVQVMGHTESTGTTTVPLWVMVLGALGISVGLMLFGPKLINMVGDQITKLNAMRAYCVALSAAITVIAASWLGLPVSSTHIAVGGIFGVGFLRESMEARRMRGSETIRQRLATEERRRRKLVRRSHFMTILAAWIITVPATASLSALVFWLLRGLMA